MHTNIYIHTPIYTHTHTHTNQIQDIDIGENGLLEIYDGLTDTAVLLATMNSKSLRSLVTSTVGEMKVVFKTGDSVHMGKGLKFTVREGY